MKRLNKCPICGGRVAWELETSVEAYLADDNTSEMSIIGTCQDCDTEFEGTVSLKFDSEEFQDLPEEDEDHEE